MEDIPCRFVEEDREASGYGDLGESLQSPSGERRTYDFTHNRATFEELNTSVQDLIYRHRAGTSPLTKKRDRAFSPPADARHDSPKRRSLTETQNEAAKDDLVSMIRPMHTDETDDVDRDSPVVPVWRRSRLGSHPGNQLISKITAELVKKFESGKEPEEKKPRSSEPQACKTDDALHDPDDLDSSHADLHDDPDPNPTMTSPDSYDNDLESDFQGETDESPIDNVYHGVLYDLDSSGSVEQLNLMQSGSFINEPEESGKNMLSLADELQQASNVSSSEDDSDPESNNSESRSSAESDADCTEYTVHHYGNGHGELENGDECSEEEGGHDYDNDDNDERYDSDEKSESADGSNEADHEKNEVGDERNEGEQSDISSPEHVDARSEQLTSIPSDEQLSLTDEGTNDEKAQQDMNAESSEDDGKAAEQDEAPPVDTVLVTIEEVDGENNDKESSLDGTDLDFSVLQSSQKLNVDVTKQRISLRQKGSLARRRRPTRTSVRAVTNNPEMNLFTDSTEPRRQRSPSPEEEEESEEARDQISPRRQEVARSSSVPGGRSNVQARTAPVLLPGLGDHIKRRTTKVPVPLPKIPDPPTITAAEPAPPPWMAEVRIRRGSRSVKPDLERVPSEPRKPESPSWMRDALTKKKRAAEIIERRASIQQVEMEQPTVPPWMKELRRTPRSSPVSNNHATNNNNLPHTEATPTPDVTDSPSNKVSNHNDSTHNLFRQESLRSPFVSNFSETRSKGPHREVLAPLKRSSVDNSAHPSVIDNRLATPSYLGTTNGQATEITSNRNMLPPLKSTTVTSMTSQDDQENSETQVPAWKKEIAARRKSKTFVPAFKPETPHKLGDMPTWKRELAERNKIKKRDSIDTHTSAPSPTPPSTPASPSLLPWQQELAQRRKRTPSITRQPTSESSPIGNSDVPSWARNVERRRARLADCGLIPEGSIDDKSG